MRSIALTVVFGTALLVASVGCSAPPAASPDTSQDAVPSTSSSAEPSGSLSEAVLPPDLTADRILLSTGLAVTVDGQHRVTFPTDEVPRAASGWLFLTTEYADDNSSTKVRVRDIRTGEVLLDVDLKETVTEVVIVDERAYFTGFISSGPPWVDVGVQSLSLADGSVSLATPARADENATRGNLQGSPSGLTIASQYQLVDDQGIATGPSAVDVTSTTDGTTREVVGSTELNLMATTDEILLTRDGERVRAYSIGTGQPLWVLSVLGTRAGYVTPDGVSLIQPYLPRSGDWVVGIIDVKTGDVKAEHPLTDLDTLLLTASSDLFAVFQGKADTPSIVYLDLRTGAVNEWLIPGGGE